MKRQFDKVVIGKGTIVREPVSRSIVARCIAEARKCNNDYTLNRIRVNAKVYHWQIDNVNQSVRFVPIR